MSTPEETEAAIELVAVNADRMSQIGMNAKKLLKQVTPAGEVSVTDTDKLRLGGYSIVPDDKHHQLTLRRGDEDIQVVVNTPANYLELIKEGHRRTDRDVERMDLVLGETGVIAHKMHLAYNVHNGNTPMSFRRYRDNPATPPDEQGMLADLGAAVQTANNVMRNAQTFTAEAPLTAADRDQAKLDAEFLAQQQPEMAKAGALLARHNAINDLERDRRLKINDTVAQHGHRAIAEDVDRLNRFERGVQMLGESEERVREDPSYQKRIANRRELPVLKDDDVPKR